MKQKNEDWLKNMNILNFKKKRKTMHQNIERYFLHFNNFAHQKESQPLGPIVSKKNQRLKNRYVFEKIARILKCNVKSLPNCFFEKNNFLSILNAKTPIRQFTYG
jgi:hypothetical protein